MIVVADTSPLNYLIQIGLDGLLHSVYQRVLVPPAVMRELNHSRAPGIVQEWLRSLPSWIDISAKSIQPDAMLASLDLGEREAIQLAQECHADLLLIDERKGRLAAQRRGLLTTGTLGVLVTAGALGLVNAEEAYERLISLTTFRSSPELHSSFLDVVRAMRKDC